MMTFRKEYSVVRLIVVLLFLTNLLGVSEAKDLRNSRCNKRGNFFEEGHEYSYDYTVKTSSAFLGASSSMAGSRFTCTVSISVPKQCDHVLKLANCVLSERNKGDKETYMDVNDADEFLQDLERYPVYFQMNDGELADDSFLADDRETLQVLNIKRGLISALQFPVLDRDEYANHTTKTDIFGNCPIQYSLHEDDLNKIGSSRKITQCELSNVHAKQMNIIFSPSIGQLTGGAVEEPISQMMYPFETVVSCSHALEDDKQLVTVDCLQKHYFRPLAYEGDYLVSAMTNISQTLKLKNVENKEIPNQDLASQEMSPKNIKFDFGDTFHRVSTLSTLQENLSALTRVFMESKNSIKMETVPGMFGDLVQAFRSASENTLTALMTEVFECSDKCEEQEKIEAQLFFLDGLESCGTDACIITFIQCMNNGYTTKVQTSAFLFGLKDIAHVSDSIVDELYIFCDKSDDTLCWLVLGSLLSYSDPSDVKEGSTLYQVLEVLNGIVDSNCKSPTLQHTERKLNTVVKTARNIGYILNEAFLSERTEFLDHPSKFEACLQNSVIPNSIKISILQYIEDGVESMKFKNVPQETVDVLFSSMRDVTMDSTVRALSFSILTKTTDKDTVKQLVKFMMKSDNTDQMKTYMTTTVRTLLQDDSPDIKPVKSTWEAARGEEYFLPRFYQLDPYSHLSSKHIGSAYFFKLPLTEMFGGKVEADLIYDPSSKIFSTFRSTFNLYYGETKYKMFQCIVKTQGLDLLMDILLRKTNMSLKELFAMYESLQAQGEDQKRAKFARFQQSIVDAVEELLDEVNYPINQDLDFSFEIAVKGKVIAFSSLKELMAAVKDIQSSLPPKTSIFQEYLKKLLGKITLTAHKSKEMMYLIRDLPTCAGLPLNMTVGAYGTHIIENTLHSDLLLYMAKRSPTLSGSSAPSVSFLHEVRGVLAVPVGLTHSTGLSGKILFGTDIDLSLTLTYGYSDQTVVAENPTKKKLELEIKSVIGDSGEDTQRLLYARGRWQLNHHAEVEKVERDFAVESTYRKCSEGSWVSSVYRIDHCLNFVYPNVTTSRHHAYFPLSGPFDFDLTMQELDGSDLSAHKWTFEYKREKLPAAGYTHHVDLTHDAVFDKEMTERRYGYMSILLVRDNGTVTINAGLPSDHYTGNGNYTYHWKNRIFDFTVAEVIKYHRAAVAAYIFKLQSRRDGDFKEFTYHWNFTTPMIGWDIQFLATAKGQYPSFTDRGIEMSIAYYCSQDLPLFYFFHLIPAWAQENHDTSKFYVKSSRYIVNGDHNKEAASGVLEFYGRHLAADITVEHVGPTTYAHEVLTYMAGGIKKTTIVDFEWTWGQSKAGVTLDLSTDVKANDYNVVLTGSCAASKTDITVTGDIEYENTADNNVLNRDKRSVEGFYERVMRVERAAVKKVKQLKEKMFGESEVDVTITTDTDNSADPKPTIEQVLCSTSTPQYSVWDLKNWKANVNMTAKLRPVFAKKGNMEGKAPEGLEATGILTVRHPWNGGYVDHRQTFLLGKNMKNTFRHFKFWISSDLITSFVGLDGTPFMHEGKPLVISRNGRFSVYRKSGEIFDYDIHYHGPHVDKDYTVLFSWEAYGHHEPLIHVTSKDASKLFPIMNHQYEETFYYETGHIKHEMYFSHKMLTIKVDTDITPRKGVFVVQNGSIQLSVIGKTFSLEFRNTVVKNRVECSIIPGSMPDKTLIYSFEIENKRTLLQTKAIKLDAVSDSIPLWERRVAIQGTSVILVTQTWSPAYHKEMETALRQDFLTKGLMLNAFGDQIEENMNKPLLEWTLAFTAITPGDLIRQGVIPTFTSGINFWNRVIGNLIPTEYNPECPSQESKIPSRLVIVHKAMMSATHREPNMVVRRLQYLYYLGIKAVSKLLIGYGTSPAYSKKTEDILKERQYSYAFNTNPNIFEEILDFPDVTEHYLHVQRSINDLFGFARQYYRDRNIQRQSSKSVAVVFGRHDSERELSVQTFDGNFFELSADKTEACTYLLASDLVHRRWSLVMAPAGVTLLTSGMTVTVGWNRQIYVDNCKLPSAEKEIQSSDGDVTVKSEEGTIHVNTTFGLYLEFDAVYDICLVTLEGRNRNGTIGLLGTNDKEKVTDYRLRDGSVTSDVPKFLEEYVISGPSTCTAQSKEAVKEPDDDCEDAQKQCNSMFQKHYTQLYNCINVGNNFLYSRYCENTAMRCKDDDDNFCHSLKAYVDMCDKKELLDSPVPLQDICLSDASNMEELPAGTQLDVVFIVSQHEAMTESRDMSVEYMFELATHGAWDKFGKIRLGVILFGGNDPIPRPVKWYGDEHNFFVDRDDFNWDELFEVSKVTEGGKKDADAFTAIQEATTFPFNPIAHKMIIVLMHKKQTSGRVSDLSSIQADLQSQGIVLNVVSTYSKTSSRRILGINWDDQVIRSKPGYHGNKSLPKNDYAELIVSTKGALWDLNNLSEGKSAWNDRIVEELIAQVRKSDDEFCPAE